MTSTPSFSQFVFNLFFVIVCYQSASITIQAAASVTDIPTNCVGLSDGTYMMRMIDSDDYPIIEVQCSNEYIIIDHSKDSNWEKYFTSWLKYHYSVAAASRNDHSSWSEWYIPSAMLSTSDDDTATAPEVQYLISPSCDTCIADNNYLQKWSTQTTYYLSALAFGCFNPTRGWPACDMEFGSYSCKLCKWNTDKSQIFSYPRFTVTTEEVAESTKLAGICDFEVRPATQSVIQTFEECQKFSHNAYKPSIGMDGRFCVCVKPSTQAMTNVKGALLQKAFFNHKTKYSEIVSVVVTDDDNTSAVDEPRTSLNTEVLLYQKDFTSGTYRITQPGTYKVMEDITFDFNAGTTDDPLADDAWWPTSSQSDEYDGAGDARGAYFLGFFAGITIECTDVVLDLQTHTLQMSLAFFFSQAFFSIVELQSQAFLPQQGPGFFGSDPTFATNTIIKNGVFGLTSHHAIHGNNNHFIQMLDLKIKDFGTHGIQLNGYEHVLIKNVDVGPSTDQLKLNGNYIQLRQILPILRKLAKAGETITFSGRSESVSMQDIINELEPIMTKAFNWAVYGTDYSSDEDWSKIQSYFVNPTGYPFGAVVYGIFLNYPSAGIFGWHVNDITSYNATLENVHITGLRHAGIEVLGLSQNGRVFCNAFNGPLSLISMLGDEMVSDWSMKLLEGINDETNIYAPYVGDIVTDTWIAMYYFGSSDFDYWPGIPFVGDDAELMDWAQDSNSEFLSTGGILTTYCNEDAMFHPSKGLLGVKISGAELISLKNVMIDDLKDSTVLGSELCGAMDLYHFSQQRPYQIGFSMNMVHAITVDFISNMFVQDISISNLYSNTGLVFGIAAWFENDITFGSNIVVKQMEAGLLVDDGVYEYSDRPNKAPEACAIRTYSTDEYKVELMYVSQMDESKIEQSSIVGEVGCKGESEYTMVGSVSDSAVDDSTVGDSVVDDAGERKVGKNIIDDISLMISGDVAHMQNTEREDIIGIHEDKETLQRVLKLEVEQFVEHKKNEVVTDEVVTDDVVTDDVVTDDVVADDVVTDDVVADDEQESEVVPFGIAWNAKTGYKAVENSERELVKIGGISVDKKNIIHADEEDKGGSKVFGSAWVYIMMVLLMVVLLVCFKKVYKNIGEENKKYQLVGSAEEYYGSI